MRTRYLTARGVTIAAIAIGFVLAAPAIAAAQESTRPVLDSAPAEVPYRGTGVVTGHMENGSGGEQITLQKFKDGDWRNLQTKSVNESGDVSYRLEDLTRSADYRLLWVSPEGEQVTSEGRARIRVAARVTLAVTKKHVMSGRKVEVKGWVLSPSGGREVILQQKVDGAWRFVAKRPVVDGRFAHDFRVRSKGYRALRAIFRGDDVNTGSRTKGFVKVYSRSYATWYGPGFYGNRTACGKRLTQGTLGVAHRTLPCGTEISLLYKGRTITVEVIDRGPYANHADWDLTSETAQRLRFSGSDTIGVTR